MPDTVIQQTGSALGRRGYEADGKRANRALCGLTSAVLCWVLLDQLGIVALIPFVGKWGGAIILAAALGVWVGISRAQRVLHLAAAASFGLWLIVCLTPLSRILVRPLKVESPPVAADAVVVLGSSIYPNNDFTDVALARFMHGLELIQEKFARRLVLTEIPAPAGSQQRAAERLLAGLRLHCSITAVGPVYDTHDEAVLVNHLMRERGWKRILLVTSPSHSRRALLTYRKLGMEVISSPCRETGYDFENPVRFNERLRAFSAALHEIVGLESYRAHGWA